MQTILSVDKIRDWDKYTIEKEPISSIDLMERASNVFVRWLIEPRTHSDNQILVIASKGNNGGDGLAVARLLIDRAYDVDILVADIQINSTPDFDTYLKRLTEKRIKIEYIQKNVKIPSFEKYSIIIDALFGSGLERPITGYWADFVKALNNSGKSIYSIDIPSGMYADKPADGEVVKCDHCLSFEAPKLGMLVPDNAELIRNWVYKSIGLHSEYLNLIESDTFYIEKNDIKHRIRHRNRFDHKGNFGHALIAGGSKGMAGAPVLAARACLRTGAGLVSALVPDIGYGIIQTAAPEIIALSGFGDEFLTAVPEVNRFSSVGIGPGMGTNEMTVRFVEDFLNTVKVPVVIDADALNIISLKKDLIRKIPKKSILTPHPGEFSRLFGASLNGFERLKLLKEKAKELDLYIILKGRYTAIASPESILYFNSSGNAGMATAGSGDVLTGMITSLLAQGYTPLDSCLIGVYLHGLAGEIGTSHMGMSSLIASDIIDNIGNAYKNLVGMV
ncbi:MAG: NAD(P)H-hydrate dehydratase [Saprospiraceae bacterium]|nr:NAD(P)H-hydrate dehydratase [Saprospiraceae bacterium]